MCYRYTLSQCLVQELDEAGLQAKVPPSVHTPHCRFTDVVLANGKSATVLLENPVGRHLASEEEAKELCRKWFS